MGRTKGVKNGEGAGYSKPKINRACGALDSFEMLHQQKFFDEDHQLTPKGERYVKAKLDELGAYNILLLESFFLKGNVDYSEIIEALQFEKENA
jgi:hypothetical protein